MNYVGWMTDDAPYNKIGILDLIYYAIFHSIINYLNLNWGYVSIHALKQIFTTQKRAFWLIVYWHPSFFITNTLPDPQIIHFRSLLILYYKFINNFLPINIHNRIIKLNETRTHGHNTRNAHRPQPLNQEQS